jgi:hypothetical protein
MLNDIVNAEEQFVSENQFEFFDSKIENGMMSCRLELTKGDHSLN